MVVAEVGGREVVRGCCVYTRAGVGFVGRNLVQYLLDNELVSHIRVADKVPPITAWLNDKQKVSQSVIEGCSVIKSPPSHR